MLDRVVSAEKYAAHHFLSGLNALSNDALTENYGWVQNVLNDKHETDTQIGSTLNSVLNTAYNVTSTVSNLHTNKILSGLNAGWEGTKKGIDSGFNKLGDWAVEYKANAGNAYSSANFVDLSHKVEDFVNIATSVTGIGAINKVNKVKKAAEAAHKLSDDLVDLEKLNQPNNINKLDDARDLTKTVDDASTHTKLLLEKSTATPEDLYKYLGQIDENAAKAYRETGQWPDNIQIPKSSDVLTPDGKIDWAQVPEGGYVLDINGKAIKEVFTPKLGDIIDRYGPPNGRYTSPVSNKIPYQYNQRSLPYVKDPNAYHQYKIVGDFNQIEKHIMNCTDINVKNEIIGTMKKYKLSYNDLNLQKGEAARAFGSPGGAIQYELPLSVEQLELIGLLEKVK